MLHTFLDILGFKVSLDVDHNNVDHSQQEDSTPKASTAANYGLQQKKHVFKAHSEDNVGWVSVVCPDMAHNAGDPLAILPPKCSLSSQPNIIKGVEQNVVGIYVLKFFTCRKYILGLHDIFLSVLKYFPQVP